MEVPLSWAPALEVLVKQAYWATPRTHELGGRLQALLARRGKPPMSAQAVPGDHTAELLTALEQSGVRAGSILVVHSSNDAVTTLAGTPQRLISSLLELVGPAGTVAAAAFPLHKGEPTRFDRRPEADLPVLKYRPGRSMVWTGTLGLALARDRAAQVSRLAINSLAARGADAEAMFAAELASDLPTACGPESPWKFCADRDAMVLGIGANMTKSLTMAHVAEDAYEDEWPVADWYRKRRVLLTEGQAVRELVMRERQPRWAQYLPVYAFDRYLRLSGILRTHQVQSVPIHTVSSAALVAHLRAMRPTAYPYYGIRRTDFKAPACAAAA